MKSLRALFTLKVSIPIFILVFLLAGIQPAAPAAAQNTPVPATTIERVNKLFAEWDTWNSPGASLAVFKEGEINTVELGASGHGPDHPVPRIRRLRG